MIKRSIAGIGDDNDEDDEYIDGNKDEVRNADTLCAVSAVEGSSLQSMRNNVSLIYVQSLWADPITRDERVSLAFLLPTGVAESNRNEHL